ncbi:hypothetical protein CEXT_468571 [Caerostris extrusa]|uniref:Uncharacterized protein n=1 Tax=Caerostris extrusa TaxID=172846 RepID=A0AAV4UTN2_CAEEX|nr:hypothetical protein CEXT_468571 [Caerostris extrusa]
MLGDRFVPVISPDSGKFCSINPLKVPEFQFSRLIKTCRIAWQIFNMWRSGNIMADLLGDRFVPVISPDSGQFCSINPLEVPEFQFSRLNKTCRLEWQIFNMWVIVSYDGVNSLGHDPEGERQIIKY